jgi:peroxiredoxin Q/BCP
MTEAVRLRPGDAAPGFTLPIDSIRSLSRDWLTFPPVATRTRRCSRASGAYGEKELYGRTVVGVIRSRFVVDEQGGIAKAMSNVPAVGHVTALRRELGLD